MDWGGRHPSPERKRGVAGPAFAAGPRQPLAYAQGSDWRIPYGLRGWQGHGGAEVGHLPPARRRLGCEVGFLLGGERRCRARSTWWWSTSRTKMRSPCIAGFGTVAE